MKKTAEIGKVIDQYVEVLSNEGYFSKAKVEKMIADAKAVKVSFNQIEITENVEHIYEALCIKGNKILEEIKQNKQDTKGNYMRARNYLRYLKAADGDFKGISTAFIQKYFRVFMATSILFLALSPQYFGFVLPALMFVPIFLGIRGVKNRSYAGLMMSLSVVPVAFMTSFIWIRFGFSIIGNVEGVAAALSQANGLSSVVATALTVLPPIFGLILFPCSVFTLYFGYKAKDYFV